MIFSLVLCIFSEITGVMPKHQKALKKPYFEMFSGVQLVNMKIVMEPLRNCQGAPSTENLIILRNFQCWLKFLVSYEKICVLQNSSDYL